MMRKALIGLMVLLAGCGFHLRGHVEFPAHIRAIHLHENIPDPFFAQNLHQQFAKVGLKITEDEDVPTVNILDYGITEDILAYSANAEPERIRFKVTILYEVLDADQKLLVRNNISKARDLTVVAGEQTVYSNVQERHLYEAELQREAIAELMHQLSAAFRERPTTVKE